MGRRKVLFVQKEALATDMASTTQARLLRWSDASGQTFTGQCFQARTTGDTPPPLFVTYYNCSWCLRGGVVDEGPLTTLVEQGVSAWCTNIPPWCLREAGDWYGRRQARARREE